MVHISTVQIETKQALDEFLSDLNSERGRGEVAVIDCTGTPYLLAAYESFEDCLWDAFGQHPYSDEGERAGLTVQDDLLDAVDVASLPGFFEEGSVTLLAVADPVAHPGLGALCYPVTAFHSTIAAPVPRTPTLAQMLPGTRFTVQLLGGLTPYRVIVPERGDDLCVIDDVSMRSIYISRDDIDRATIRDVVAPGAPRAAVAHGE